MSPTLEQVSLTSLGVQTSAEATQIISLVFIRLVTSTAPVSSVQFEFVMKFPVALPSVQFQTVQSLPSYQT